MVYIFDGSKAGFLTAFLLAYEDENALLTSRAVQLSLGERSVTVETDKEKAKRVEKRLLAFDTDALFSLDRLLRSGMENHEQIAFRYFKKLATEKRSIDKNFADPDVFAAVEYMKKVGHEIHKFHGFVRFMELKSGALYAPISPDNDICDLLLPHFRARLPEFPFVLHDVARKKAAVYDGKNAFVAPLGTTDVLLSADEEAWQSLWKNYYKAVNIPSRERLKQMRGYMPVRYWKFLTEKQEKPPNFPE